MTQTPTHESAAEIVLVGDAGRAIGLADKTACHRGPGRLHRALTCVLFDGGGRLLFARRSPSKPTWPGYWDATVATHQLQGERDDAAARRRVRQELGLEPADVRRVTAIKYQATYSSQWSENEVCAVLLGRLSERHAAGLAPAVGEIDRFTWVTVDELGSFVATRPVTPWFHLVWQELQRSHRDTLAAFLP